MATTSFSHKHLTPHEAICDAANRMIQGLDDNDSSLLASAFTPSATYDLRAFSFLGFDQVLSGSAAITSTLLAVVGKMDTTHMLSNFRTTISANEREAELRCYALAQHWRPGEGQTQEVGSERSYLMGNRYRGTLSQGDDGIWRFESCVLWCVWSQGDVGVWNQRSWNVEN